VKHRKYLSVVCSILSGGAFLVNIATLLSGFHSFWIALLAALTAFLAVSYFLDYIRACDQERRKRDDPP
jgi:hypothetical protein